MMDDEELVLLLIYGEPGSGKTTLACSAAMPLVLDCEDGMVRVNGAHSAPSRTISSWRDIETLGVGDVQMYKTIVIDALGDFIDLCAESVVSPGKMISQREWGIVKQKSLRFINTVRRLWRKDLVIVSHAKSVEKIKEKKQLVADASGTAKDSIVSHATAVGYVSVENDCRTIDFRADSGTISKDVMHSTAPFVIPKLGANEPNTFLFELIKKIKGECKKNRQLQREKTEEYNKIIADINAIMSKISPTADSFNAAYKNLQSKNFTGVYGAYWRNELSNLSKKNNITFNRTSGVFEQK